MHQSSPTINPLNALYVWLPEPTLAMRELAFTPLLEPI